ncbi:MAG: M48 family metalloprotease [Leptolyngbyaceae bacterium]|nr:M48 family metalloprotease [Leptolyngbyaceae bacterium]
MMIALVNPLMFDSAYAAALQPITGTKPSGIQFLKEGGDRYHQAREELPDDWYVYYRIVDRITRANRLDIPFWTITLDDNDQSVAYAYGAYALSFDSELLDLMQGDISGVAYVVAHEIAHHTHHHNAANIEFQRGLSDEISDMLTGVGGFDSMVGEMLSVSDGFEDRTRAFELMLELEAEETAIDYLIRAGFNPESALSVFEIYEDLYGTTEEMEARQEKIQSLLTVFAFDAETAQVSSFLTMTHPMHYELSEDRTELHVSYESIDYVTTLEELLGE